MAPNEAALAAAQKAFYCHPKRHHPIDWRDAFVAALEEYERARVPAGRDAPVEYVLPDGTRTTDKAIAEQAAKDFRAARVPAGRGADTPRGVAEAARHLVEYSPLEIRAPDAPYHVIAYRVNADAFEALRRALARVPVRGAEGAPHQHKCQIRDAEHDGNCICKCGFEFMPNSDAARVPVGDAREEPGRA